ncbi:MAG: LysR family transcriptional regulator [Deltaproteobacteria bacterium]|nr:LysR family transcriptional regulator [Myxococcales bacterium]MDP3219272.1 LysR family transcriptional regulator [Deltaproteobacteria bacterium]
MNWDDLRYALAVARAQTLSGAAEALGVSHTTVGRRLRSLDERLGVRLFDATPEGFHPTAAGADLVAVAERIEADTLSLEGRVLGRDERLSGALRVSAMELVFRAFREAFTGFAARYPSVALTVTASDDEVSLARREADVVLRLTNKPPVQLVGRRVGRMQFVAYAARSLAARVGEGAPLGAYPWIHWDERLGADWLDAWLAQHAPGASIVMRVDVSAAAMHELIAAGVGVQFLASVEGDADPSLVRVGPVDPFASRDLWVLTLPELRDTPRVRAFTDHMAERLRATLAQR